MTPSFAYRLLVTWWSIYPRQRRRAPPDPRQSPRNRKYPTVGGMDCALLQTTPAESRTRVSLRTMPSTAAIQAVIIADLTGRTALRILDYAPHTLQFLAAEPTRERSSSDTPGERRTVPVQAPGAIALPERTPGYSKAEQFA
jgi:hypothetical protein